VCACECVGVRARVCVWEIATPGAKITGWVSGYKAVRPFSHDTPHREQKIKPRPSITPAKHHSPPGIKMGLTNVRGSSVPAVRPSPGSLSRVGGLHFTPQVYRAL
jgi:hypothetical protein